jgi:hypothetical protein
MYIIFMIRQIKVYKNAYKRLDDIAKTQHLIEEFPSIYRTLNNDIPVRFFSFEKSVFFFLF